MSEPLERGGRTTNDLSHAVPEPGQLVRVRDRHWVVTNTVGSTLPDSVGASLLVELSSVEDDAYGDELAVFWEAEPGTVVLPKATLPDPKDGFDDPARLSAFLDAVRWGAIASADVKALQAPFRSGISIEDYQLDPVVRALQMPRANLLVADDVGLGKTIEAGLVVQELLLRHRARTVLIVCPSTLCLKWHGEMRDRFGLEFRIVNSEAVKRLRRDRGVGANIWTHFPRLIVSIDWLKGPRAMALLDEVLPADTTVYPRRFDLLIVDEVHQCAPSGRGAYATDSLRTIALRTIAPHFEHRLFLSATPHNGYTESFTALLELLDPQRFFRSHDAAPARDALRRVMVRRLKSELRKELPPRPDGTPRFPQRNVVPLEVEYPEAERRAHDALSDYTRLRRRHAHSTSSQTATDFVTLLLKKRLFSSPKAFLETLREHLRTLRRTGAAEQVSEGRVRAEFERLDDDMDSDDAVEEHTADALATAARAAEPLTTEQERLLETLLAWAEGEEYRPDAKAAVLIDRLLVLCRPSGVWNDERVIVFTEYRDTQRWLQDLLIRHGVPAERIALLFGGMEEEKRERIKAEFQAPPDRAPVRILIATDAASEGIDLQLQCHRIIHVEIPFSPTRLEQRNGRIDRHGQPSPTVEIEHFVGQGYERAAPGALERDFDFLWRIAQKVSAIRDDLGSAGPVLALQVEEAMLGRRTVVDEAMLARAATRAGRASLRFERDLRAEIARLRRQLDDSVEELGITPRTIERVVAIGLELARQPKLTAVVGKPGCFRVGALSNTWALATSGLADPLTDVERPITFDHEVADRDRDVVLAHLEHRLVSQATRLLRAEIWKTGGEKTLHRIAASVAADRHVVETTVLAHARLVVTGGDGRRLHEEVIVAGGRIRNARFARLGTAEVKSAMAAATEVVPEPATLERLATEWPSIEGPLYRALESRGEELTSGLDRRLRERADAEIQAVTVGLEELRRNIEAQIAELEGEPGRQLRLQFTSGDEAVQFDRDLAALRRRHATIPSEIAREQAAIARRYATPQRRVFPAAVTFVVPALKPR